MATKPAPGSPGGGASRDEKRRPNQVRRLARPRMVDLTTEPARPRRAVAEAEVEVSQATLSAIIDGEVPKGDVFAVAETAGVVAAKRADELIPLAHTVPLTDLVVRAAPDRPGSAIRITAEAAAVTGSGVEVEALMAVTVAALTVYDMVKDLQPSAAIRSVRLVSSSDGEREWHNPEPSRSDGRAPLGARAAGRVIPTLPGVREVPGGPKRRRAP